jgi:hypothetical protein
VNVDGYLRNIQAMPGAVWIAQREPNQLTKACA